ncbi:MAG: hypothetical protein WAM14_00725 [Candidatus Nitrosopolaris sp.]
MNADKHVLNYSIMLFTIAVDIATKYPLSIRNDLIRIEHNPSTVAEYWIRVPVGLIRGGLWIGLIKPHEPIPKDAKICKSNCINGIIDGF